MGTYTTNKELFMPSIGEQGWGELVNNNFSTIDAYLKPIAVSGSTYTFTGNLTGNVTGNVTGTVTGNLVGNQSGGTITATKITNSGTLTQTGTSTFTGKITANGGVNDYEARITALEAGEFETVNCAGTITAEKLCGKRVGVFTTTKPYEWSPNLKESYSGNISTSTSYVTYTYTPDYSKILWWDDIEVGGLTDTYLFSIGTNSVYPLGSVIVTFTDISTGEEVSNTITSFNTTTSSSYFSISGPIYAKLTVQIKYASVYAPNTMSISISQSSDVYIKPKGT